MRTMLAVLLLVSLASCGGDGKTVRVLAAASLTGPFDELAEMFEAEHDGVSVQVVYDSSATLATQVSEGAPADVLATADLDTMQRVLDAGDAAGSSTFAGNTAVLVTPKDNPADLTSFADLGTKDAAYVVCVDTAPCGKVAAALLAENDVTVSPSSYEDNVKAVLEKVVAGEVDAGIVYDTDARAAGDDIERIEIPGAVDEVTGYGIATVEQTAHPDLAQAFVDLVLSAEGQQVLRDSGFAEAP